jgi:hypothetical protein
MHMLHHVVEVEWATLAGLAGATIADLMLRYFAFGRFDSVAIDIAFFTTAYSGVEVGKYLDSQESERIWLERFGWGAVCLLLLGAAHVFFRLRVEDQARAIVNTVSVGISKLPRTSAAVKDRRRQELKAAEPLIVRSVLLTIVTNDTPERVREGKTDWRAQAADFLNTFGVEKVVHQSDFLLPIWHRRALLVAFFVLGAIALIAPVLTVRAAN